MPALSPGLTPDGALQPALTEGSRDGTVHVQALRGLLALAVLYLGLAAMGGAIGFVLMRGLIAG